MGKMCMLLVVAFFAAIPSVIAEASNRTAPAVVSAVVGSDAVRLSIGEDDVLAGLYGVTNSGSSREMQDAARSYLTEVAVGAEVEVRFRATIAGLDFVEVLLPSGENLNLVLLTSGLARFDHLSAGDDPAYREAVDYGSHTSDMGDVAEATGDNPDTGHAKQMAAETTPISIEEFRWRRQLLQQTMFEAGLEKWRRMPQAYRRAVYLHYSQSLRAHLAQSRTAISQLESQRLSDTLDLIDTRLSIEANKSAIQAEQIRGEDDFDLRWNTNMYERYRRDYLVDSIVGDGLSARMNARMANRYGVRAHLERARVNEEVAARVSPMVEHVRALEAAAQAREANIAALNMRLRTSQIRAQDRFRRLQGALQTVQAYDAAISTRTQPVVPIRPVLVLDQDDLGKRVNFQISGSVWRIDWYLEALDTGSVLSGDVFSAANDAFVGRFSSTAMPHEAFHVLEGPGEYYIRVNPIRVNRYIIEILELDYP